MYNAIPLCILINSYPNRGCRGDFYLLTKLKVAILDYIKENFLILIVCVFIFIIGIISGGIMSLTLSLDSSRLLFEYIQGFMELLRSENILDSYELFISSLNKKLTLIGAIWILGFTIIGIPLIFILVFIKGFILGFTVTFLTSTMSFNGFLFSFIAVMPHNILFIPVFFLMSIAAISFSIMLLKNHLAKRDFNLSVELINYMVIVIITTGVTIFASLIEAYITPTFMNIMAGYM